MRRRSTTRARNGWPLRWTYPSVGLLLALGNASVALAIHTLTPSLACLLLATSTIFVALGYWSGFRADRLRADSATDYLTGLGNRREFERRLSEALSLTARYREPFALLIADIDHFKSINDMHGHLAGDSALRVLGQCLRDACRAGDFAARWGGDEFAIIAPHSSVADASSLAERLGAAVRELSVQKHLAGRILGQARVPRLSLSIGIAIADPGNPDRLNAGRLFAATDAALRLAKVTGGDRAVSADALVPSVLALDLRAGGMFQALPPSPTAASLHGEDLQGTS
jgi:diguanylate cyclase (GGDEF)-like protein